MGLSTCSPVQLIIYDADHDLLPIIVANCNYALSDEGNMEQSFDFEGIQKEIEDRFIIGKSHLQTNVNITFVFVSKQVVIVNLYK